MSSVKDLLLHALKLEHQGSQPLTMITMQTDGRMKWLLKQQPDKPPTL